MYNCTYTVLHQIYVRGYKIIIFENTIGVNRSENICLKSWYYDQKLKRMKISNVDPGLNFSSFARSHK
jgi:hypothetical protein